MSHLRYETERARQLCAQLGDDIDMVYHALDGDADMQAFHERHGVNALLVLTQYSRRVAAIAAQGMANEIVNKRVIEIGAGVGCLAVEMAKIAASVVAIEADPAWSWLFTRHLYREKPPNLTWVFGTAQSVAGNFSGDVAVIFTRSDEAGMRALGYRFAPLVLMPLQQWGEPDTDGLRALVDLAVGGAA